MTKIAIVDIETTGPRIEEGDQIIQIAAVIVEAGVIIAEHSMLINPETEIPYHISQLTGITQEEVSKAPTFKQVAGLWFERLRDCYFVAHNLALDLNFLAESFAVHGNFTFQPQAIDTVKLAKILLPDAPGFNLTDLSEYFGYPFTDAHDALADAKVTTQLVHQLAQVSKRISSELRVKMLPFVTALPNDESLLLSQPELFSLDQLDVWELQEPSDPSFIKPMPHQKAQQLSQLVLEQLDQNQHLVVEDPTQPIASSIMTNLVDQLLERNTKFCLAVTRLYRVKEWKEALKGRVPEDKLVVIKAAKHFIHLEAFEQLIKQYNIHNGNQQEYVIIAATLNWLSYSSSGDFDEINKELNIQPLLVKNCSAFLGNHRHAFYQQMIKRSARATVILTDHGFLADLTRYYEHVQPALFERVLVVDNLSSLTQQIWYTFEDRLSISHWFTQSRLMVDQFNYSFSTNESWLSLKTELSRFTASMHELLQLCQRVLKQSVQDFNRSSNIEHYLAPSSNEARDIIVVLQELEVYYQQINRTIELDAKELDVVFKSYSLNWLNQFRKLKSVFEAFTTERHLASYWVIRSEFIQGQPYHIQLIKRPLVVNRRPIEYLQQFKQVVLISPGNYQPLQKEGTYQWLQLYDFTYYTLPKLSQLTPLSVEIPVEYLANTEAEDEYQALALFIEDELEALNEVVVILVNSKAKAQAVYRKLSHSDIIKTKYVLLSQGVSGSMRKLKRKAIEMKPAIIILSWTQLVMDQWSLGEEEATILLDKLPFDSPKNSLIQAKGDFLGQEEEAVFQHVLLPSMVHNLKMMTSHISQTFHLNQFYLLDDRVFTKYYAKNLQEELAFLLKFDIRY